MRSRWLAAVLCAFALMLGSTQALAGAPAKEQEKKASAKQGKKEKKVDPYRSIIGKLVHARRKAIMENPEMKKAYEEIRAEQKELRDQLEELYKKVAAAVPEIAELEKQKAAIEAERKKKREEMRKAKREKRAAERKKEKK
jgi:uncharacterized protein involved in exopolysaccharide biosynthesis